MVLFDEGVLALDDPVEKFLPEFADRRVLRSLGSRLDDTVPATRSITVEDLLTFRLGFGNFLALPGTYPIQHEEARLGLATLTPPWPPPPFERDEWIARFATLPLMAQPGQAWHYNTGAELLGFLIERATGQPLEVFLRERLFDPLGMHDTSFSVPPDKVSRFTPPTRHLPRTGGWTSWICRPPGGGVHHPPWPTWPACWCRPSTTSGSSCPCWRPEECTAAGGLSRPEAWRP